MVRGPRIIESKVGEHCRVRPAALQH
jgi:hypothetical protein